MNITLGDIILEKDENGTSLGQVVSAGPVWVNIHWLTGVNSCTPGGTWACPTDEAHKALESGEWQLQRGFKNIEIINGKLFNSEDA